MNETWRDLTGRNAVTHNIPLQRLNTIKSKPISPNLKFCRFNHDPVESSADDSLSFLANKQPVRLVNMESELLEHSSNDMATDENENTDTRIIKHGKQDPKVCGVCGDKALGNNFNAITCESCKAFFRRNALRPKEFVCPFSNACKMDPVTRRFCQKCRLKKCFDIGMKKEWIMTDEEKKIKKQKIEQNRMKRASSEILPTTNEVSSAKVVALGESIPVPLQKQPMMPHNNNSIARVQPTVPSLKGTPERRSDFGVAPLSPNEQEQPVATVPIAPMCENVENTNSNVTSKGDAILTTATVQAPHVDVAETRPSHVSEIEDGAAPMPLLESLIRPGVSDSPPDAFKLEGGSVGSPETHEICTGEMSSRPPSSHLGVSSSDSEFLHFHPHSNTPSKGQSLGGRLERFRDYEQEIDLAEESQPLPLNTMDSILSVAISAEYNAFSALGHTKPLTSKELNRAEKVKLSELAYASQALNAPVDADGPVNVGSSDPSLINVINLTDIAIRRLIKMSKKICAFKNMCQEDQIALLKGGCTEMMILRSVVSYDPERDSWNIPHSNGYNIKLGVLKEARGNLYEEHQRFVKSFKPEWRSDDNIMIILCAITLFTPERPNVVHKDVVKLEQDSYYYLLKRYLESTRNGCEARSNYLQLIRKIAELHALNSNHLRVFLEVNPREVEPLLIEIFDLKQ